MPSKSKWREKWDRKKARSQASRSVKKGKPEPNILERWKKEYPRNLPSRSVRSGKPEPKVLVKCCKPEHNISKVCDTIKFGTLEDYRDMDPSFAIATIADEDEGKDSTSVKRFDFDSASKEALESLKGSFPLGRGTLIEHSKVNKTFPNCFIWCCSRAVKPVSPKQCTEISPDYTDFYNITDGDRFGKYLMQLLDDFIWRSPISESPFTDSGKNFLRYLRENPGYDSLETSMFHHDVVYVDEKEAVIDHGQLRHPYDESIPPQFRALFAKKKKYEKQREHRFVFLFQSKRNYTLAVKKEPVIVPIDLASRHLIDKIINVDNGE